VKLKVAASTAHLLVACKVKSDIDSRAMQRLQSAGHAVKTASEHLVMAAQQAISEDERTLVISQRMVSGIAQVAESTCNPEFKHLSGHGRSRRSTAQGARAERRPRQVSCSKQSAL
jgi:hypothetical protein